MFCGREFSLRVFEGIAKPYARWILVPCIKRFDVLTKDESLSLVLLLLSRSFLFMFKTVPKRGAV